MKQVYDDDAERFGWRCRCWCCGGYFFAVRRDAKTCGDRCRQRYRRHDFGGSIIVKDELRAEFRNHYPTMVTYRSGVMYGLSDGRILSRFRDA